MSSSSSISTTKVYVWNIVLIAVTAIASVVITGSWLSKRSKRVVPPTDSTNFSDRQDSVGQVNEEEQKEEEEGRRREENVECLVLNVNISQDSVHKENENLKNDLNGLNEELSFIQHQLSAERNLRLQAESQCNLIQHELERLHRELKLKLGELNHLQNTFNECQIELDVLKASESNATEHFKKVEKILHDKSVITAELESVKHKYQHLIRQNAHERNHKEQLLKENIQLKAKLTELLNQQNEEEEPQQEEEEDEKVAVSSLSGGGYHSC